MTDTKFTQGPWNVVEGGDGVTVHMGEFCDRLTGENILYLENDFFNAHLIAAAPDMYEALDLISRRLQLDIDDGSRPDQWSMEALVNDAQRAMRKARDE